MCDDREDRPPADPPRSSEQAVETDYVPEEVDPVEAKQRLLRLIDNELDETPKGREAKKIVNELPIEE